MTVPTTETVTETRRTTPPRAPTASAGTAPSTAPEPAPAPSRQPVPVPVSLPKTAAPVTEAGTGPVPDLSWPGPGPDLSWPGPGPDLDSTGQLIGRIGSQLGSGLLRVRPRHAPAPVLLLAAHGSRDPRALATVRVLLERVRELRPGLDVRLGHVELDAPLLTDALRALDRPRNSREVPGTGGAPHTGGPPGTGGAPASGVVLVPLLLSRGRHVKHELPAAARARPALPSRVAAPLGPHPLLVEALRERLADTGWRVRGARERATSGVVLAAAGSRDPDAAADTRATAELLAQRLGVPVVPAYSCAATPTVPAALRALAARGRHRVAVASYFTAPGRCAARCAEAAPGPVAAPLGAHPAVARLVLRRYDEARAGAPAVPPLFGAP
ncbi:CbiX/SirB N-terminal domain-containing protein [Streptomyces sp. NPDC049954]|uniref:sirohydrochlorin chelatase n=1 Tax=Streptomyces sp. NPDC049954 TaxID=3155779 RepID=UPI003426DEDD